MLLPLSWLKEFLPRLPAPTKLAETLAMHGLEVEQIIDRGNDYKNVVVGEIVAIRPHPDADKLRLADVVITPGGKPQEIVCGAPNIEVGQKAPVALLGAKLPNGLTIAKRKIRGVESNGMLCAADELGLGKDHSGIIILDSSLPVGTPFATAMGFDEPIFDLAIPANRSDLMAVRGLAWEIGAILGQKVKLPRSPRTPAAKGKSTVSVKVIDPKLAPVYMARVIRGVTMKSSPTAIQNRLRAAGMRPINGVVDITNYIMLEYGQPLHAFDAAQVKGMSIVVRPAKAGETLTTLDNQNRKLDPSMLVIADPTGPIALAGVMGGLASEVTDKTTDIILESAIFHPVSIRKTSRRLGLVSEASKRFEKGLWPSLADEAGVAAATMIAELGGGTVQSGVARAGAVSAKPRTVKVSPAAISERLGKKILATKAKKILVQLGFVVTGQSNWSVKIPAWRPDVAIPEDIVDEVGRMNGYADLPSAMPTLNVAPETMSALTGWKDQVRQMLVGMGFTEIITHSYYGQPDKDGVGGEHVEVANPLDASQQYLRKSLVPSMKKVLEATTDAGRDAQTFEIARVFNLPSDKQVEKYQPWKLVLGLAFKSAAGYVAGQAIERNVRELCAVLGVNGESLAGRGTEHNYPNKGRTIELLEWDLAGMLKARQGKVAGQVAKYPPVTRDISFWWPHDEQMLSAAFHDLALPLLQSFQVKDKFSKEGKISFAVTFVYQSADRTLTKAEVDLLEAQIKDRLIADGATIR